MCGKRAPNSSKHVHFSSCEYVPFGDFKLDIDRAGQGSDITLHSEQKTLSFMFSMREHLSSR